MNKDITSFNNKNQRHGYWEIYLDDKLWFNCFYHNGQVIGYHESYIRFPNESYIRFPNEIFNKYYYLR